LRSPWAEGAQEGGAPDTDAKADRSWVATDRPTAGESSRVRVRSRVLGVWDGWRDRVLASSGAGRAGPNQVVRRGEAPLLRMDRRADGDGSTGSGSASRRGVAPMRGSRRGQRWDGGGATRSMHGRWRLNWIDVWTAARVCKTCLIPCWLGKLTAYLG
jgi:hypothetical protein